MWNLAQTLGDRAEILDEPVARVAALLVGP
jgi:hypothetical protein